MGASLCLFVRCAGDCTLERGWGFSIQRGVFPICGDSFMVEGEQCDDGNAESGDGCSSKCQVEEGWRCVGLPSECAPDCGDGMMVIGAKVDGENATEVCDDNNKKSGDGCNSQCQIEPSWQCVEQLIPPRPAGGADYSIQDGPSVCSPLCEDSLQESLQPYSASLFNCDDPSVPGDMSLTCFAEMCGMPVFRSCAEVRAELTTTHYCLPLEAPKVIDAYLHSSFTIFYIDFDVPTNRARVPQGNGKSQTQALRETCLHLLDDETYARVGSDAECLWARPSQLAVSPGRTSKVRVGQQIGLKGNVITGTAQSSDMMKFLESRRRLTASHRSHWRRLTQSVTRERGLLVDREPLVARRYPWGIKSSVRRLQLIQSGLDSRYAPKATGDISTMLDRPKESVLIPPTIEVIAPSVTTPCISLSVAVRAEGGGGRPLTIKYEAVSSPGGERLKSYINSLLEGFTNQPNFQLLPSDLEPPPMAIPDELTCIENTTCISTPDRTCKSVGYVGMGVVACCCIDGRWDLTHIGAGDVGIGLDPDLQLKNDPLYQALILESNTTTRILLHDPRGGLSSSRRDAAGKAIESDPFIIRVTVQNFLNLTAVQDVTIRFVLQDLPVITSRAQSQLSLRVRQDALLGAKPIGGAVENCAVARTDDVETVYKWRQRTQELEQWRHALDVDALKALSQSPASFRIPPNSVKASHNYTFDVIAFYRTRETETVSERVRRRRLERRTEKEKHGLESRSKPQLQWLSSLASSIRGGLFTSRRALQPSNSTGDDLNVILPATTLPPTGTNGSTIAPPSVTIDVDAMPQMTHKQRTTKGPSWHAIRQEEDAKYYPTSDTPFSQVTFEVRVREPQKPIAVLSPPRINADPRCPLLLDASRSRDPTYSIAQPKPDYAPRLQFEWTCHVASTPEDGKRVQVILPPEENVATASPINNSTLCMLDPDDNTADVCRARDGTTYASLVESNILDFSQPKLIFPAAYLPTPGSVYVFIVRVFYKWDDPDLDTAIDPIFEAEAQAEVTIDDAIDTSLPVIPTAEFEYLTDRFPTDQMLTLRAFLRLSKDGECSALPEDTAVQFLLNDEDESVVAGEMEAPPYPVGVHGVMEVAFVAIIRPEEGVLQANRRYTFTMMLEGGGAVMTVDSNEMYVNAPPALGVVTCSPSNGTQLLTEFTLTQSGWQDDDTPLHYRFASLLLNDTDSQATYQLPATVDVNDPNHQLLGPWSVSHTMRTKLRSGDPLFIIGWVRDSLGAVSYAIINITVDATALPPTNLQRLVTSERKYADSAAVTSIVGLAAASIGEGCNGTVKGEVRSLQSGLLDALDSSQQGTDISADAVDQQGSALLQITNSSRNAPAETTGTMPENCPASSLNGRLLTDEGETVSLGPVQLESAQDITSSLLGSQRASSEKFREKSGSSILSVIQNTVEESVESFQTYEARRRRRLQTGEDDEVSNPTPFVTTARSLAFGLGQTAVEQLDGDTGEASEFNSPMIALGGQRVSYDLFQSETSRRRRALGATQRSLQGASTPPPSDSTPSPDLTDDDADEADAPVVRLTCPGGVELPAENLNAYFSGHVEGSQVRALGFSCLNQDYSFDPFLTNIDTARRLQLQDQYERRLRGLQGEERLLQRGDPALQSGVKSFDILTPSLVDGSKQESRSIRGLDDGFVFRLCAQPREFEPPEASDTEALKKRFAEPKTGCRYYAGGEWTDEGCSVLNQTDDSTCVVCLCTHLTSFGAFIEEGRNVLTESNYDVLTNFNQLSKISFTTYGIYFLAFLIALVVSINVNAIFVDARFGYSEEKLVKLMFMDLMPRGWKPKNPGIFAMTFIILFSFMYTEAEIRPEGPQEDIGGRKKKRKKKVDVAIKEAPSPEQATEDEDKPAKKKGFFARGMQKYSALVQLLRKRRSQATVLRADSITDGTKRPEPEEEPSARKPKANGAVDVSKEDRFKLPPLPGVPSKTKFQNDVDQDRPPQPTALHMEIDEELRDRGSPLRVEGAVFPSKDHVMASERTTDADNGTMRRPEGERSAGEESGSSSSAESSGGSPTDAETGKASKGNLSPTTRTRLKKEVTSRDHKSWSPRQIMMNVFKRDHPVVGLYVIRPHITCLQRCLVLTTTLTCSIFLSAFFFGATDVDAAADPSGQEVQVRVTFRTVWVGIFSICLSAFMSILLAQLFLKKVYYDRKTVEQKVAIMRTWHRKHVAGVIIAVAFQLFCIFYLFMFVVTVDQQQVIDWLISGVLGLGQRFIITPIIMIAATALLLWWSTRSDRFDGIFLMLPKLANFTGVVADKKLDKTEQRLEQLAEYEDWKKRRSESLTEEQKARRRKLRASIIAVQAIVRMGGIDRRASLEADEEGWQAEMMAYEQKALERALARARPEDLWKLKAGLLPKSDIMKLKKEAMRERNRTLGGSPISSVGSSPTRTGSSPKFLLPSIFTSRQTDSQRNLQRGKSLKIVPEEPSVKEEEELPKGYEELQMMRETGNTSLVLSKMKEALDRDMHVTREEKLERISTKKREEKQQREWERKGKFKAQEEEEIARKRQALKNVAGLKEEERRKSRDEPVDPFIEAKPLAVRTTMMATATAAAAGAAAGTQAREQAAEQEGQEAAETGAAEGMGEWFSF
ncbi:unnamed protein product [Vitrella brassicaformis CCMP3155]|uniref:PKD/REJ-like domain-containing protein n=4 Tax=Vitrella brassicaformis TaxID=1169539 RepID=A0A0G4E8L8_VITBC|nr:unnamed protein product [Vitrella brassicaformis CCMP3155]|eukprot:CEL91852.1 unnamed protein product [Vitrella brassicaformis CCMP3155]